MGKGRERTIRILLLSRIREGEDDQGRENEQSVRIWPFFDYEAREADSSEFSFLYLFPYKDDAFERNLFPLFRILHWDRDSKGRSSTDLLWGLYKRSKKEGEESWEIAHLIHWTREGKRKAVSFLHGLFRYSSDEHGATLRFLFFPFPM